MLFLMSLMVSEPVAESGFDLASLKKAEAGQAPASGDIVVQAKRKYERATGLPDVVDPILPKAEVGLGGGATLNAHVEKRSFPGATSNRAMVTATIPF